MKTALVLGAGGFIGSHMVRRLKSEGYWVRGVDLKYPDFSDSAADEFIIRDLSVYESMNSVIRFKGLRGNFYYSIPDKLIKPFDEIYQFAADMGGAGYIFTGDNDSQIMENSALINLNLLRAQSRLNEKYSVNKTKIFYSSSACMYPEHKQLDVNNPGLRESDAYPANPDSEYGWEKLLVKEYLWHLQRIMIFQLQLLDTTTSMVQRELGLVEKKRLQPLSVEKLS